MLPILHIEKTLSELLCDAELFSRAAAETTNQEALETDRLLCLRVRAAAGKFKERRTRKEKFLRKRRFMETIVA